MTELYFLHLFLMSCITSDTYNVELSEAYELMITVIFIIT